MTDLRFFLSYRRNDDPSLAGWLRDRLVGEFGEGSVFIDVDDIPVGVDFRAAIRDSLDNIDVVILLIGPRWNPTRLSNTSDPVRAELEETLRQDKLLVPLLIGETAMPKPDEFPVDFRAVAYLNALHLRQSDFHRDTTHLIERIRSSVKWKREQKDRFQVERQDGNRGSHSAGPNDPRSSKSNSTTTDVVPTANSVAKSSARPAVKRAAKPSTTSVAKQARKPSTRLAAKRTATTDTTPRAKSSSAGTRPRSLRSEKVTANLIKKGHWRLELDVVLSSKKTVRFQATCGLPNTVTFPESKEISYKDSEATWETWNFVLQHANHEYQFFYTQRAWLSITSASLYADGDLIYRFGKKPSKAALDQASPPVSTW